MAPAVCGARTVRVFAVQPKLDLAWMQSRATYHDKMFALADRRLRGPSAPLMQHGAADFASHLLGPADPRRPVSTARDLVAWPEDIGLLAALTGQRAAAARSSGSLTSAIVALLGAYAPQNGYYASKYPAVASRTPQVRLLALSLTDTFARTAVETFSEMARRYRVWLEAGIDMAQDWKVVCNDKAAFNSAHPARLPDGERCAEQNPGKVALLGDPGKPARDYAYEATSPNASNMALVFDPLGRLRSRQVKTYLTPTELPGQLDLVPGEVSRGLGALRTPVGTLGFVTSKDAWMPDVQDRLDEQHVDVLVQPEFFVNDVVGNPGMWAPDTMLGAGYSDALRLPSVRTMVEPDTDGNIFEFTADAQSHIVLKPHGARDRASDKAGHLVGQPDHPGLASVMRWVVRDPIRPHEPFPARRHRLDVAGRALQPGSGKKCPDPARPGPCENGQVEGVLWRDITVGGHPRRRLYRGHRVRTPFSPSRAVAPSDHAQRNAAVAMRGRNAVVAFEEHIGSHDVVLVVRSRDRGRSWSRPVRAARHRGGRVNEWWPSVALGPGREVTVAWGDDSTGVQRAYFARSTSGGRTFAAARVLDPASPAGVAQWRPVLAQGPGGTVHAVFVDERARSADDDLPQAGVYYTRIVHGVARPARLLDGGTPAPLAAKLHNAWEPRIAVRGRRVLVAWIDFLNYDWGVFSRASSNGGGSFGPQRRVTDNREGDPNGGTQQEELAASPDPVLTRGGPLIAWTDFRKSDSAATIPHQQYDIDVAVPGGRNRQVDPYGRLQKSTFSPSACAGGGGAFVAFQDAGAAQSRIRLVPVRAARRRRGVARVDDGGARAGDSWRPRLACTGRRVLAVWESERDGPDQIYAAFARPKRLP